MKKVSLLTAIAILVVLVLTISTMFSSGGGKSLFSAAHTVLPAGKTAPSEFGPEAAPVELNGQLAVQNGALVNSHGAAVQLRGMSSHGLAWFPEFTNREAMDTLRGYGANVFRVAMYSAENNGYITHPEENKKLMYAAVENVLASGMYAIVDWHIREDGNPLTNMESAIGFFDEFAAAYAGNESILYEICNEPGYDVPWRDVVEYALAVIPVIRKHSPNAIIIVGTPRMCTDLSGPVLNPLPFENIMYTYHYYSDHSNFEKEIDAALEVGLGVFVTEWGVSEDEKTGEVQWHLAESFDEYVNENNLSWTNWSLADKDEIYSAILPNLRKFSGWTFDELTASGQFFFAKFR